MHQTDGQAFLILSPVTCNLPYFYQDGGILRLDNTGAGVIEVNQLLLGNHMTDNVDLYIK